MRSSLIEQSAGQDHQQYCKGLHQPDYYHLLYFTCSEGNIKTFSKIVNFGNGSHTVFHGVSLGVEPITEAKRTHSNSHQRLMGAVPYFLMCDQQKQSIELKDNTMLIHIAEPLF